MKSEEDQFVDFIESQKSSEGLADALRVFADWVQDNGGPFGPHLAAGWRYLARFSLVPYRSLIDNKYQWTIQRICERKPEVPQETGFNQRELTLFRFIETGVDDRSDSFFCQMEAGAKAYALVLVSLAMPSRTKKRSAWMDAIIEDDLPGKELVEP